MKRIAERRRISKHGEADDKLIGGPERRRIEIVDYDPRGPDVYVQHRARVAAALGGAVRRIEHVGSTAVRAWPQKPMVDVLVTVADADDEGVTVPALTAAGYGLRVREPGHRMFRTPACDVHVHVWSEGNPDMDEYAEAKRPFIESVLKSEEGRP